MHYESIAFIIDNKLQGMADWEDISKILDAFIKLQTTKTSGVISDQMYKKIYDLLLDALNKELKSLEQAMAGRKKE